MLLLDEMRFDNTTKIAVATALITATSKQSLSFDNHGDGAGKTGRFTKKNWKKKTAPATSPNPRAPGPPLGSWVCVP